MRRASDMLWFGMLLCNGTLCVFYALLAGFGVCALGVNWTGVNNDSGTCEMILIS